MLLLLLFFFFLGGGGGGRKIIFVPVKKKNGEENAIEKKTWKGCHTECDISLKALIFVFTNYEECWCGHLSRFFNKKCPSIKEVCICAHKNHFYFCNEKLNNFRILAGVRNKFVLPPKRMPFWIVKMALLGGTLV